jgi:hypothetical protein
MEDVFGGRAHRPSQPGTQTGMTSKGVIMNQTSKMRRTIVVSLVAGGIALAACGQGSSVQDVQTQPASPAPASPAASLYADMSADAVDNWSRDLPGVRYSTSAYAGMSADALSHWFESTVAPSLYPQGDAAELPRPARGPAPY